MRSLSFPPPSTPHLKNFFMDRSPPELKSCKLELWNTEILALFPLCHLKFAAKNFFSFKLCSYNTKISITSIAWISVIWFRRRVECAWCLWVLLPIVNLWRHFSSWIYCFFPSQYCCYFTGKIIVVIKLPSSSVSIISIRKVDPLILFFFFCESRSIRRYMQFLCSLSSSNTILLQTRIS